jgi:hypothetical protein
MTSKSSDGRVIPGYYKEKKYAEIERYIKDEADGFSNFFIRLYKEMPQLFLKFKSAI